MKKILVGIDGSPESKQAAEFAAQIAKPLGAGLTLVYVAATPAPMGPEPYAQSLGNWDMMQREYGNALLREVAARCAESGDKVETRFEFGPAAETLANIAEQEKFDMLAVGHRGRGRVERLLLGSVADRLAQISRKPVLVWRG